MEDLVIGLVCIVIGWPIIACLALYGIICFLLVITIPFGIGAFRIAGHLLRPFGTEIRRGRATGLERSIFSDRAAKPCIVKGGIIWIIFFAWGLVIMEITAGIILFCTGIGFILGITYFKMIPITVWPLGVKVRG
jgi:uncharacterized membrane protein YccF (DUF307 family)